MKKTIYFFTTVTLCSLCIFSYPQILSAQDNTSEKTEVTFMVSGTGDYAKTQKEKLEQQLLPYFPDIEITVEAYPEEQYYTLLNTKLSMGEGPDFFDIQPNLAGPNAVQKLAPAGYLEPLDDLELVQKAPAENKEPVSCNGHVYSLTHVSMTLCTYYNKQIFQELNLSIPQNWPEFLQVCEKIKQASITPIISGNKDSYSLQFGLYQIAANQVYANNPLFNQQLKDGITAFTAKDTWDKTIDQYLLLYKNNYVQSNSLSMSNAEAIEHFINGDAAMIFNGNFSSSYLTEKMTEDALGAFPLPANETGSPIYGVISSGGGTAIYSGSKHVDLCKKIWEKLHSSFSFTSKAFTGIWDVFQPLLAEQRYTINCNQGWLGDVEWVLEDGISQKIAGDSISVSHITALMQKAYDEAR